MRIISILFLCIAIASCSKKTDTDQSIKLNLRKQYDELHTQAIIDSSYYIQLETIKESILPGAKKCNFCFSDSLIFIYNSVSKKVIAFDYTGKFRYSIDKHGKGPFEYIFPTGFLVDDEGNLVIIDFMEKAIIFNPLGTPITEIKFQNRLTSLKKWKGNGYVAIENDKNTLNSYNLVRLNSDFKISKRSSMDSALLKPEYHKNMLLDRKNDDIVLIPHLTKKLFLVTEDLELDPIVSFDLGKKAVREKDDMNDIGLLNTKAWIVTSKLLSDWLFLVGGFRGLHSKAINIRTKECFNISRSQETGSFIISDLENDSKFYLSREINNNLVFGVLSPAEFNEISEQPRIGENDNFVLQIGILRN